MSTRRTIQHSAQRMIQQFLDIVFPPHCVGCKLSGHVLCPACLARIQPLPLPCCQHCGAPLSQYGRCNSCYYHPLKLSGMRTASAFQEPLRSFIHALKYGGNMRLAEPLGHLLAHTYTCCGMTADLMVPVPLHSERERQRGYNHAYLLAEVCCRQLGLPLRNDLVVRHRATLAQVGLQSWERHQNVTGAFLCPPALATGALYGRKIVIVDDVSTTGATLEACAAPLFAAGASQVWGLVLARSVS